MLDLPDALAFDSSGNLYVANYPDPSTVSKFVPGATTASGTLSTVIERSRGYGHRLQRKPVRRE